jgi:hypothetical protein
MNEESERENAAGYGFDVEAYVRAVSQWIHHCEGTPDPDRH